VLNHFAFFLSCASLLSLEDPTTFIYIILFKSFQKVDKKILIFKDYIFFFAYFKQKRLGTPEKSGNFRGDYTRRPSRSELRKPLEEDDRKAVFGGEA
jgi:hypothetical protein